MTHYSNELYHHGIQGQKWGIRRYQNSDGSLTAAGRKRYAGLTGKIRKIKDTRQYNKTKKELAKARKARASKAEQKKEWAKDPETLRKHMDAFTDKEIDEAIERFTRDQTLADIQNAKTIRVMNTIKTGAQTVTEVLKAVQGIEDVNIKRASAAQGFATAKKSEADMKKTQEDTRKTALENKAKEREMKDAEDKRRDDAKKKAKEKREERKQKLKDFVNDTKKKAEDRKKEKDEKKAEKEKKDKASRETIEPEVMDAPNKEKSNSSGSSGSSKKDVFDAEYTERPASFSPKLLTYKSGDLNSSTNSKTTKTGKDTWESMSKNSSQTMDSLGGTFDDIDDLTNKLFGK